MVNIIPGNPVVLEGMPTDGLLAGLVCLSPTLGDSLRDAVGYHWSFFQTEDYSGLKIL